MTHFTNFSLFLIRDCQVPSPSADDWFKRPGAQQRLCMTSENTLCIPHVSLSTSVYAAQIGRHAVLTRIEIVTHGERELKHKQCFVIGTALFLLYVGGRYCFSSARPAENRCFICRIFSRIGICYGQYVVYEFLCTCTMQISSFPIPQNCHWESRMHSNLCEITPNPIRKKKKKRSMLIL